MIKQFFNFKSQNPILPQLELLYKEFANIFSYSLCNEDLLEHLSKLQHGSYEDVFKELREIRNKLENEMFKETEGEQL